MGQLGKYLNSKNANIKNQNIKILLKCAIETIFEHNILYSTDNKNTYGNHLTLYNITWICNTM